MKTYFYGANAYYDALELAKIYAEENDMEIKEFPLARKIVVTPKERKEDDK